MQIRHVYAKTQVDADIETTISILLHTKTFYNNHALHIVRCTQRIDKILLPTLEMAFEFIEIEKLKQVFFVSDRIGAFCSRFDVLRTIVFILCCVQYAIETENQFHGSTITIEIEQET